ncbi:MAG: tetratricopeptide repeat protein [Myxococcales bacterium]|nr:tetratricopeptide repeat protein [Myxococcota bacterium]MDW8283935.1 tetratricopeptide repeat protein [Myxococcales bacterium]
MISFPRGHQADPAAWALARARALLDLGRPEAAAVEARRAVAQRPQDPEALQLYGLCLLRAEDPAAAAEALCAAVAMAPEDAHAHYLLGYARREQGRPVEAEACYREALRLAPEEPVYLRALAELLAMQQRHEEALRLAQLAVAVAPDRPTNLISLGFVASTAGDRALARRCYEQALRLDPTDAVAWNNLGCIDLAQGRPMQARWRFREALRLDPRGRLARDNLALVSPPPRPPEVYRLWSAFERQAVVELCNGVLLQRRRQHQGVELELWALLLATGGRALPVVLQRTKGTLLLAGLALPVLRLLRAGPAGAAAVLGSGAAAFLLVRGRLEQAAARYRELLGWTRASYEDLHARWLAGLLSRTERDAAIDRLLDELCCRAEQSRTCGEPTP